MNRCEYHNQIAGLSHCARCVHEIKVMGRKEVIEWFKNQGYENMNHSGFKIICKNAEEEHLVEKRNIRRDIPRKSVEIL